MEKLLEIMARLRDPESGCPWDKEQTFLTIAPHTIEEAYEVADAIERGNMDELRDELGDLLFQVVFYAQMASEQGSFDFREIANAISEKMLRRHPHVFADDRVADVAEQSAAWERHKAAEREARVGEGPTSHLAGVARARPALVRADKLQKRAAKAGFDWQAVDGVLAKVREELGEIEEELSSGSELSRLRDEVGDLLFSCVNLARHLAVDAESSLRQANDKFEGRFRKMESLASQRGPSIPELDAGTLEVLWEEAKREVRDA